MRLHKDAKTELIRSLPLFRDCTPAEIAEVAAIADEIDLPSGRRLAVEKADGQEFVVIIEGRARVSHGEETLATLGAGEFFGEIAVVTGTPRTADVTADGPVHALIIEGHAFRRLLEDAPSVEQKVLKALSERTEPH